MLSSGHKFRVLPLNFILTKLYHKNEKKKNTDSRFLFNYSIKLKSNFPENSQSKN